MEPFHSVTSNVIPLPIKDIDTDMIIPAEFLRSTSRDGYGQNLFKRLREQDPEFPLNLDRHAGAKILATDSNFGCGSSREHAVWAIQGAGIRVVVAPSFSDIFSGNSGKNGLVLVTLPRPIVMRFIKEAQAGDFKLAVDLEAQTVTDPDGATYDFPYDAYRRDCILDGIDDLAYMLSYRDRIAEFKRERERSLYYSTLTANNP